MSSGIYISFPGSTRQSLIWSPLVCPTRIQAEDESCSQWDRLSGHRCGRLPPEQRTRPTHQIFTLSTNIIMESDSGASLSSNPQARGPRHSPRHRVRAYQPHQTNYLHNLQQEICNNNSKQTVKRPSSATVNLTLVKCDTYVFLF